MAAGIDDIPLDEKPEPADISRLAEAHFGAPVVRITAPGGNCSAGIGCTEGGSVIAPPASGG